MSNNETATTAQCRNELHTIIKTVLAHTQLLCYLARQPHLTTNQPNKSITPQSYETNGSCKPVLQYRDVITLTATVTVASEL